MQIRHIRPGSAEWYDALEMEDSERDQEKGRHEPSRQRLGPGEEAGRGLRAASAPMDR